LTQAVLAGFALSASLFLGSFPAHGATLATSLQGEVFSAENVPVEGTCNPNGNSTITFTASGVATGPYPGTFTANGIATIGPQMVNTAPGGLIANGTVLLFHEDFTINSPVGQVNGSKDLELSTLDIGDCITVSGSSDPTGIGNFLCGQTQGPALSVTQKTADVAFTYQATIQTTTGTFSDSGRGGAAVQDTQVLCTGSSAGESVFSELFSISNGVVPVTTLGKATGGGQIYHTPPDNSHITFGFTADSTDRGIRATCTIIDNDIQVRCIDATNYAQSGNAAVFSGNGTDNGVAVAYTIQVQDNHDSGIGQDTFSITTSSGYSASGVLTQGNIQVHS
jgi:hypothetical protein